MPLAPVSIHIHLDILPMTNACYASIARAREKYTRSIHYSRTAAVVVVAFEKSRSLSRAEDK